MRNPSLRLTLLFAAVLVAANAAAVTVSTGQAGVDLEQVFRCAATDDAGKAQCTEARGLITNNCTICHTFVPIVMMQFDDAGWTGLLDRHVSNGRVNQLTAEQVATIHDYLAANFNGSLPPPELPPELLETWTSY